MSIVEKIQEAYARRDLEIWGISHENSGNVKQWMLREQHQLRTVIDRRGKTFDQYQVEGIPSVVVIDREGKIVSYYLGNQSEQSLRGAIDLALEKQYYQ
jgi:peroxiredoxin